MGIPHTVPGRWPDAIASSRFASRIRRDSPAGCRIAILGLADDLGVRLNSGRPGAKEGPTAFRGALARYGVAEPYGWDWPAVFDAGDIVPAEGADEAALHETHRRVTEATRAILDLGLFPVGIGGGHDLTFPFVRAVAERLKPAKLAGVYFDAHLDVRETVGSGMPFRRLVDDCGVGPLDVHGVDEYANSREHREWFTKRGGRVNPAAKALAPNGDLFVSVDLDVLDASHAPGVSAINPAGWSVPELEGRLRSLGTLAKERVHCLDIMELDPAHDVDGRTARVAARLFLRVLASGFGARK